MTTRQTKWAIETPAAEFTRQGVKATGTDLIGYCIASTPEKAIAAFREAHKIPDEIKLTAKVAL